MSHLLDSDVALIAVREIRQRTRGKLFRAVTVLMLLAVGAAIVIPSLAKGGVAMRRVAFVGSLPDASRAAIAASGTAVDARVILVPEASLQLARDELRAGAVSIVVVEGDEVVTKKALDSGDTSTTGRLARAIAAVLGEQQAFARAGLTPAQTQELATAKPLRLTSLEPKRTGATQTTSVIGVILLFILLSQYNTWTLVGVMEEKASRVVEVLLATVRPMQLLAGKVLGIGLLVFAQAGLIAAVALGLGAAVGSDVLRGAAPAVLVSTLVWLVLGYAFYSWVYAAVGSLGERQDQVQALAIPVTVPMVAAYIFAVNVASTGSAPTLFRVLAYVPPTAPFAMPILVGLHDAAWWQVVVSAAVSVAATFAVAILAATVYRRAVLRTGRRVSLREVLHRPAR